MAALNVEYRDISDFPGYRVGNNGSVWTRHTQGHHNQLKDTWRQLRPGRRNKSGHLVVMLHGGPKGVLRFVHHLVLEAFIGPRPLGTEACHDPDRDPGNNRLSNLRWGTHKENGEDTAKHGMSPRGERNFHARFTDADICAIRHRCASGSLQKDVAKDYSVSPDYISVIVRRKIWRHLP